MKTLRDILTGGMDYGFDWAIYAQKKDGKFDLGLPARFGQKQYEGGGIVGDGCEYFSTNQNALDSRANYCGTGDNEADFYQEWAEQYLEEINSIND